MLVNKNKVAFIISINDEDLYLECVRYINALEIPEGIEIEIIELRNEKSMTSAYNNAIKTSDSKYKVYLHQDTLIINKQFIIDILNIFNMNSRIGMIGVIGCGDLKEDCIYWNAKTKFGKVYESHTGVMKFLEFDQPVGDYEVVNAIDGLIMITQYDLYWREDIFDGWHFYDISQSREFQKNGYYVVIPKQKNVWCLHDCGIVHIANGYEEYRQKFISEYVKIK